MKRIRYKGKTLIINGQHITISNPPPTPVSLGYGRLYNWYTASDANLAPTDWKVPEVTELTSLITYLSNNGYSSEEAKVLKSTSGWFDNGNGTDIFGYNALPAGLRNNTGFNQKETHTIFWTATEASSTHAWRRIMYYNYDVWSSSTGIYKYEGYSIRLLYDGTGTPTSVTDIDGNVYDVVKIGTQYWTVQNWKCTRLNNGISIPNVTDDTEWDNLGSGTGIDYLYGCLYNWYAIDSNSSNLVDGLKAPSSTELDLMITYIGGTTGGSDKLRESGLVHWDSPNAAVDTYTFALVGTGYRDHSSGNFTLFGDRTFLWVENEFDYGNGRGYGFVHSFSDIYPSTPGKPHGFSIRCMRALTTAEQSDYSDGDVIETVYDYDGNSYGLIKIGTQGWMNANLRTTHYADGTSIPTGFTDSEWAALTTAGYCVYDDSTLDNPNGQCAYDNDESNV